MSSTSCETSVTPPHPRVLGWFGTTALAMGGSNQMIFLITALFVGQGAILGQGSAAVPLLIFGVLLGWAAAPAWTELVLMWPNRVGGISAACAEAFRPYNPVLSALTGTCYWWGWVPTCGLTALLSASAIQQWYLPGLPVEAVAITIVCLFTLVNLCGIKWVARLAIPIATASASLAFISALAPILAGDVDWQQAFDYHLTTPFEGWFGDLTSVMAGLYLIGFAAPAFEAAACHVGETKDPNRNVPRAMLASAVHGRRLLHRAAAWCGSAFSVRSRSGADLATVLGPTFAPLLGSFGKAAAIWFIMLNMFHGTLQPLAGAARTLSQLADDGLLPRFLSLALQADRLPVGGHRADRRLRDRLPSCRRSRLDDRRRQFHLSHRHLHAEHRGLAAAARHARCGASLPGAARHHHARRDRRLDLAALGHSRLPAVRPADGRVRPRLRLFGRRPLRLARHRGPAPRAGLPAIAQTLHVKLTGAMVLVLILDGIAYLVAVNTISAEHHASSCRCSPTSSSPSRCSPSASASCCRA